MTLRIIGGEDERIVDEISIWRHRCCRLIDAIIRNCAGRIIILRMLTIDGIIMIVVIIIIIVVLVVVAYQL